MTVRNINDRAIADRNMTNRAMTDPGSLNRRLTLETPVETPDGAGGSIVTFGAVATLWAEVMPLQAGSTVRADARGADVSHRIVIRAGTDVSPRHRFRDGPAIYDVIAVRERGRRRFLEILAVQRID